MKNIIESALDDIVSNNVTTKSLLENVAFKRHGDDVNNETYVFIIGNDELVSVQIKERLFEHYGVSWKTFEKGTSRTVSSDLQRERFLFLEDGVLEWNYSMNNLREKIAKGSNVIVPEFFDQVFPAKISE